MGKWTKERLVEQFEKLQKRIKRRPTVDEFNYNKLTPSSTTVRNVFGSWTNFVVHMGLKPNKVCFSDKAREGAKEERKTRKRNNWDVRRHHNTKGYIMRWEPNHPNATKNGYILEHRFFMSLDLDRPLNSWEIVHHRNGVKDDNRRDNLELLTKHNHYGNVLCPYCNQEFLIQ